MFGFIYTSPTNVSTPFRSVCYVNPGTAQLYFYIFNSNSGNCSFLLRRGVEQAKVIREKSKLETTSQFNKAYDKGRTAIAERTIQTVRNQAKTLISHLEENAKTKFADGHPIHLWSYVHATWLLNRYHVHSALGMTPYQCVYGRPYLGRICEFGSFGRNSFKVHAQVDQRSLADDWKRGEQSKYPTTVG